MPVQSEHRLENEVVRSLWPDIFTMCQTGYSFGQIALIMNQAFGQVADKTTPKFNIHPSTLETYFNVHMQEREAACVQEMAQQIAILESYR